jgi:haloalkane dehalogenase
VTARDPDQGEPAHIAAVAPRDFCRSWRNQTEIAVVGNHLIQKASGRAIADRASGLARG